MPGTRRAKHFCTLALAALLALSGCYARRSIPSDPPEATPQAPAPAAEAVAAPAQTEAPPAPAPAKAEAVPAPAQAKNTPAPAQPAEQAPAEFAAQSIGEKSSTDASTDKTAAATVALRQYSVQIGAFGTEKNAQGAVTWLKEKGFDSARMMRMEQGQAVLFRVRTGAFQDLAAAHKALETLKVDWPQAFIPGD